MKWQEYTEELYKKDIQDPDNHSGIITHLKSDILECEVERLLLNHVNTPRFLAPGGEEFNPGPETRLDRSELLCNKVLLKYKGDRESF